MSDTELYPVTIIADRYTGVYSGGLWLAFNLSEEEVPYDVSGDDVTCCCFWASEHIPVGIGNTPNEALVDLERMVKE